MTEKEREKIIQKINKKLIDVKDLEDNTKEIKKLEENSEVKKYIELRNKIMNAKRNVSSSEKYVMGYEEFNSLEKVAIGGFHDNTFSCNHDILIHLTEILNNPDSYRIFSNYYCLECNKQIYDEDILISKRELDGKILKLEENVYACKSKLRIYRNLYFKLLYEKDSIEEAQEELIRIFNNNGNFNKLENKNTLVRRIMIR